MPGPDPGLDRDAKNASGRTAEDEALLDRIAGAIARWGMTVPAIFMLETSKPLSFVGSQFLHFLSPIVHTVLNAHEMDRLAVMLEKRHTMEDLIRKIEHAEDSAQDERRDARSKSRKERSQSDAGRDGRGAHG